jgi:hypothetical protein
MISCIISFVKNNLNFKKYCLVITLLFILKFQISKKILSCNHLNIFTFKFHFIRKFPSST